jgi:5S rRNA maturation endonuclease (ribonuclease M5)
MPVQPSLFDPNSDLPDAARTPTTDARLASARVHGLLHELQLLNDEIPVIVEGRRDVAALRRLGLRGTIATVHCGQTVAAFGERINRRFASVILLLDWDQRGRQLHAQLTRHLEADWEEYNYIRQELIGLCKSAISCVEELPAWLTAQDAPVPSPHLPGPSGAGRQSHP